MDADDLCFLPAVDLLGLIRRREISPVELTEIAIARAEALQPVLNPFATTTFALARERARELEEELARGGPLRRLHGLPVTLKDLLFTKGIPTKAGSRLFADRVPEVDAVVVERLRAAGAVFLGKTTTPELGWKGCGDSPLTGISHNPWKLGFNAGGSSTGAAICAAAGIGWLHQGSDGAGSIRMPAAFCGVFGFKPSFGRVPYWPAPNNDMISHIGPITRTVADAALMLEVMAGPDDRDPTSLDAAPEAYLARLEADMAGKKIAFSPDLGYLRVDPEIRAIVERAVSAFEEMGAVVEPVDRPWPDPWEAERCFYAANYAGNLGPLLDARADEMDPGLVACARDGLRYTAADWVRAKQLRAELYDAVRALFERFDFLVTPTLSVAAFEAGRLFPPHWEERGWEWHHWAGFCYPFNLTWVPAATCPCGFTADGLPVGLQIVGGRHRDLEVLRAARAFERARPWAGHKPPLALASGTG
ncbi:MAG: amidase [Geminicoccaceae bacterium]|nr:amidase [Geminicoccaceae bacterium]